MEVLPSLEKVFIDGFRQPVREAIEQFAHCRATAVRSSHSHFPLGRKTGQSSTIMVRVDKCFELSPDTLVAVIIVNIAVI